MIFNKKMGKYLTTINEKVDSSNVEIRILKGANVKGEPYFYLVDNCMNISDNDDLKLTGKELTQFEWDCNEIYINDLKNMDCLVKTALSKVNLMKDILIKQYPLNSFDIVMSIDDEADDDALPSVTIRFYAIRNKFYYILHDKLNLESFNQPILIDSIN